MENFNIDDYFLEFADTPEKMAAGLSNRPNLSAVAMLFPAKPGDNFWMQGCLVAIDILFLDILGDLIDFRTLQPPAGPDEEPQRVVCPSDTSLVLELPGGEVLRKQLAVGDNVIDVTVDDGDSDLCERQCEP